MEYLKLFYDANKQFFSDDNAHNYTENYDIERIHAVFDVCVGENVEDFIKNSDVKEPWFSAWSDMSKRITTGNREIIHKLIVSNVKVYLDKCLKKWEEIYGKGDNNNELNKAKKIFAKTLKSKTLEEFRKEFSTTYEKFIEKNLEKI